MALALVIPTPTQQAQTDLASQVQELLFNLPNLPDSKLGFATSLINQFSRNGTLSIRQIPYVAELVALATGKPQPSRNVSVGSFAGIIGLFKNAGAKLQHPKIHLQVNGQGIVLSVAGEKAKVPGSVNIAGEGVWPNREWYGRVSPEGEFNPSRSVNPEVAAALVPLLQELSSDPVAAVQRYGKLTGHCMFCHKVLSDDRSKAAGFGETCAKNYSLHEQWKQAAK